MSREQSMQVSLAVKEILAGRRYRLLASSQERRRELLDAVRASLKGLGAAERRAAMKLLEVDVVGQN